MIPASRLARRVALLLALPVLAACGTLRMYEGPERPREEVARIEEDLDTWGLAPLDDTSVEITAVDGVSIADHSEGTVEVLPGPHTLEVKGTLRMPSIGLYEKPHGTIAFDAQAGGSYELVVGLPGKGGHAPAIIMLLDADTDDALGDTTPPVELAQTATIDFAGPPWPVADWVRTDYLAGVTFLPPGQTLDDWEEMVETQAYLPADPDSLEDPVNRHVEIATENWEDSDPPVAWTEHPGPTGWRVLEYHGAAGADRQREEHGVVMVGGREGRVHVLVYAARSPNVLQANSARWQGAFERAELAFPAY